MCKKRVCVVVVIVLGLARSANALQIIDDFEGGNLDIWDVSEGQDGVAIGPDPLRPGNNCLVFSPETTTMRTPWGLPQGKAETLFYRLMYDMEPGGTVTLILGPSDPIGTAWGNYYCIARMNSYGDSANVPDMDVATGASGYTGVVQADLEPMRWYNVLLDIDTASRKYDVYIDDVLVFQGATFRSANSPPNLEYVDDIVIGGIPIDFPPVAYGPKPRNGTLHEDTWINLSWRAGDYAVSHDVYIGDNFDDVNDGAEGTFQGNQAGTFIVVGFPGFAYPDGLVPGTTYYWRIDEVNDTEPNSPWKGPVWSFSIPPKTAYAPNPADNAELVATDASLSWTGGFGAKLHTVYFGDNYDDVDNAAGGLPQATATYDPGPLELAKTYYWRVDEFDIIETFKGDVWSFTTQGAVAALAPSNGAVDVKQTQIITWSPSVFAASHEVYFGADNDAVKNANTGSPEYKGTRALGSETYDPGMLEWDTTYYWRIDEVNSTNPDSPWPGILWSFTTANFLIVDDFESYNDIDPPDPQSNRIFEAWPDGYEIPTNGALVGNDAPPYAEQDIVHSGIQSMPYIYDNSVGNSEATHTLTYPRDWTENGVSTLSIWFKGISDNAAETLYVVHNGSAVVNHDNPNAAQIDKWTEWVIPLQAFADQGVNLANVNTIGLGFGDRSNPVAGGSGTMYFDDIRLYRPAP